MPTPDEKTHSDSVAPHVSHADQTSISGGPASEIRTAHPNGHFYSPVVDPSDIATHADRIWPQRPNVLGIDFDDEKHRHILETFFPRYIGEYDYPEKIAASEEINHFFTQNTQFSWLDSRTFFVLLREWRPRRLLEVGSGFSTLLAADVKRRFLQNSMELVCVEPYPRPFLRQGLDGVDRLVERKVQDVSMEEFERLEAGDVLFIDSSHVAKTGSDVNFLYFDVLPRLKAGVRIHVHDIFLPNDYPREWIFDENRSWNEQYLLRALLMYTSAFKVDFSCSYAFWRYPELVRSALALPDKRAYGGSSIWLHRC